jgi:glutathione S-transferase
MSKPIIYHIPVCPFSQRVEILLELKGLRGAVEFRVVDITKPRDPHILELSRGTTALPIMDLGGGRVLKESLVILRYVEEA